MWICASDEDEGESEEMPMLVLAKWSSAEYSRSGRSACTASTRWKGVTLGGRLGGNSASHLSEAAHCAHWPFCRSSAWAVAGSAAASDAKAGARSGLAHGGRAAPG